MGVFPILTKDALNAEQRSFWDELTLGARGFTTGGPETKKLPDLYNAWMQFPEFGQAMLRLADAIRGGAHLSGKLREMVVLTTSILLGTRLEYEFHSAHARIEGLSDGVIAAIGEGMPPPFSDEVERIVYEANVQLVRTATLTPQLREEVIGVIGYGGLMQLMAAVGLYVIVSYTTNVADIKLADNYKLDIAKLETFLKSKAAKG
jgi:4-carboxymuconolactone decarboxylase